MLYLVLIPVVKMIHETPFEILPTTLLGAYSDNVDTAIAGKFEVLMDSQLSADSFSFYTSVSAVFSSKIEGEEMELDSFIKHKLMGIKFTPDHTQKIDDLYEAYQYAKEEALNADTIKQAHILLTKHILQKRQQGQLRTGNMFVTTNDGKIEYVACSPGNVKTELDKLYNDIETLLTIELKIDEVLFFASLIHLVFVKIHPFNDGNGRTARLLEKWFIAGKLGDKAWFIRSEEFYYKSHDIYYSNIRLLGLEYELLQYDQAQPFLLMLPQALSMDN